MTTEAIPKKKILKPIPQQSVAGNSVKSVVIDEMAHDLTASAILVKALATGAVCIAMQQPWDGVFDAFRGANKPAAFKPSVGLVSKGQWLVREQNQIAGPFSELQFRNKYSICQLTIPETL